MRKIFKAVLISAALTMLVACGDGTASSVAEPVVTPETTVNSEPSATAEPTAEPTAAPTATPAPTPERAGGIRPEFKAAMDSYEAFYAEYCDFMKKFSADPTNFELITGYASLLARAQEMDKAFAEWEDADLSDEELKYYLEVNSRVLQMLADAVG